MLHILTTAKESESQICDASVRYLSEMVHEMPGQSDTDKF